MFTKILVALDHSSEASVVFDSALSIAQPKISEILLVHFIDWQIQNVPPWVGIGTLYDINLSSDRYNWSRQYLQQHIEESKTWLETYVRQAIAHDISCEFECRLGNCNWGISDRAKEWGADLIVIGRRGHRNISEIVLGSVSNYVIHHAPCSVLVVQGEKATQADISAQAAEVQS